MNGFVGEVTTGAAEALGIAPGIPVTAATIDSITSAIGTGALGPTEGSVVIGTTSVLVSHINDKRGDLMGGILAVPSPLSGMYYVMAENGVGGRALEWFLRNIVYADDAFATAAPTDVYDRAMAASATVPAGSGGAQFLPWLLGSIAPHPNDDVRGAFIGLDLEHTRSHLTRAVLEGVALNVAWLLPYVETFVGNEFPVLRFGGGGAMSPLWTQILADATGRPVDRLDEPRATNARGAAFLAFAELGVLDIHDTPALLRVAEHHQPDPEHRDVMDAALHRLAGLHPALALHHPGSHPRPPAPPPATPT
jgi:xylulokinase